ncbi:MAG: acetoin:2,6-dichlorophenolindophenol oxidoreductase subunit beta [Thermosediminibacterales bacterium]|nr:acetoin:2,6-dichlorophenolindophenol oxidoreductase subunit beta [Thermosediminibacterales bacterium]MDK2836906.1 acetoin:2,6-dichlorophenolindophenol oxidoreductase subunit beta [Thermosediminibacterales bacterium]
MREITYAQAICEALDEEMARDENVILLGEDVGIIGGNFKTSVGLYKKYGEWRVKDTPISESGFTGLALGAAITGLRPVVEIMFSDFMAVCFDQIINQIAKIRYMSGGQVKVPLTIRTPIGGGRSSAAQHSQSLQALVAHIPGLKVVLPSTAEEAKGLLKTAIREDNPVVFMEHKMEYNKKYLVPEGEYTIPFGKARIAREGSDITIVATSSMVMKSLDAAKELEKDGIETEIIDIRTIVPLDKETIVKSVIKTGKLLIVDEGHIRCGIGAEIAMSVLDDVFYDLDLPIQRMGTENVPLPFSPALEFPLIPDAKKIYQKVKQMM